MLTPPCRQGPIVKQYLCAHLFVRHASPTIFSPLKESA